MIGKFQMLSEVKVTDSVGLFKKATEDRTRSVDANLWQTPFRLNVDACVFRSGVVGTSNKLPSVAVSAEGVSVFQHH